MAHLIQPISSQVWEAKYRYRHGDVVYDHSIEDTWARVAKAIAKAEKPSLRKQWEKTFYQALENFQFLPGGRILAGAGTKHKVTLFNCFVMDIAEDSIQGIFKGLSEGALTLQEGGGVGYDFSVLRPKGDIAHKTGIEASGPVSFMRIWDAMCSVLLSTGSRRGAMMGVLRVDHPDIEAFIAAKREARELRHFNVSVLISDAFMQAVKNDEEWPLIFAQQVYKKISARKLWHDIIRSAYDYAEPGVLFSDTINRNNNLWYCEKITATNPCGEIPLPPYGACDLGSINLTQFVSSPFTSQAKIEWTRLEETVSVATRFLDNVIDVSRYPLTKQKAAAYATRRIGLGVTGLADLLVMLGIPYGSEQSLQLANEIMRRVAEVTWYTSIALAAEKGKFPLYQEEYLRGEFVKTLSIHLQQALGRNGVRNSHHNTIAPAGTISLLANNVSNGIEPIFSATYQRHVRLHEGETETVQIQDYAYLLWKQVCRDEKFPPAWQDTTTLSPDAHLAMQSVMQSHIDNAISKTINIPRDFPFEKLAEVYSAAYELGLKGCTIFRPNPVTGSVLQEVADHCCPT